jgi:hypothetical protein
MVKDKEDCDERAGTWTSIKDSLCPLPLTYFHLVPVSDDPRSLLQAIPTPDPSYAVGLPSQRTRVGRASSDLRLKKIPCQWVRYWRPIVCHPL